MLKKTAILSLTLLKTLAISADQDCRTTAGLDLLESLSGTSVATSIDYAEAMTAWSFHALGWGKIVTRVATPLNQQNPDYVPCGWGRGSEQVTIETLDGVTITGNWLPSSVSKACKGTVLMFHGNGMNADHYQRWAKWFSSQGFNALAFTIQGYPGSGGSSENLPVSSALLVEATFRFLKEQKQIPFEKVIVYGFSLGGAYATYAGRYFHVPVILQNTFTSIGDMPQNMLGSYFPGILGRALARANLKYQEPMPKFDNLGVFANHGESRPNSFNNIENLKEITRPVMVLFGENDDLMGGERRARQLYRARYGKKSRVNSELFVKIPGGSHTDVFLYDAQAEECVERFLKSSIE